MYCSTMCSCPPLLLGAAKIPAGRQRGKDTGEHLTAIDPDWWAGRPTRAEKKAMAGSVNRPQEQTVRRAWEFRR
jgi:hypothetical protein